MRQTSDTDVANFLSARIQWVVDDSTDPEKLARKVKACSLANERKRKAFVIDGHVKEFVDMERVKRKRCSIFSHMTAKIKEETYAACFEVYLKCRTCADSGSSSDMIIALLPSPAVDEPVDQNLVTCVNQMKGLIPKHQKPKVGVVEVRPEEIGKRLRTANPFQHRNRDSIVFTCEDKQMSCNPMKFLDNGSLTFNKWPVPATPFDQLPRLASDLYDKMLATPCPPDMMELCDDEYEETPVEASLENAVIPFPKEHSYKLAQEFINVFGVDVLVDMQPGSGEKLKAALLSNIRCVAIAASGAQKKFVIDNLTKFVESQRLVTSYNSPAKPPACLAYERARSSSSQVGTPSPCPSNVCPSNVGLLPTPAQTGLASFGAGKL